MVFLYMIPYRCVYLRQLDYNLSRVFPIIPVLLSQRYLNPYAGSTQVFALRYGQRNAMIYPRTKEHAKYAPQFSSRKG
jgi:hypothetical protein